MCTPKTTPDTRIVDDAMVRDTVQAHAYDPAPFPKPLPMVSTAPVQAPAPAAEAPVGRLIPRNNQPILAAPAAPVPSYKPEWQGGSASILGPVQNDAVSTSGGFKAPTKDDATFAPADESNQRSGAIEGSLLGPTADDKTRTGIEAAITAGLGSSAPVSSTRPRGSIFKRAAATANGASNSGAATGSGRLVG